MGVLYNASGEKHSVSASISSPISMCCWARLAADRNTYTGFVSYDDASSNYAFIGTWSDGTQSRFFTSGVEQNGPAMTIGDWYFFAYNFTNGTNTKAAYAAHVNDANVTDYSFTANANIPASGTLILGNTGFGDWMNGTLMAVKVWSGVALSQAEFEAERWFITPQRTDNLYAWYPLDDGVISTTDYSGNGRTLTAAGTPTVDDNPPITRYRKVKGLYVPAGGAPPAPNVDGKFFAFFN